MAARAIPELAGAFPEIPDELGDRAADCAEPLLAIADYAGGNWPADARKSLVALQGGHTIEDESTSTRLLADIYTVFGDKDRIASKALLQALHDLEEAPWADWFRRRTEGRQLDDGCSRFAIRSLRCGSATRRSRGSIGSSSRTPGPVTCSQKGNTETTRIPLRKTGDFQGK